MKKVLTLLIIILAQQGYSQLVKLNENEFRYYFKYKRYYEISNKYANKVKQYNKVETRGVIRVFQVLETVYVEFTTSDGTNKYTCIDVVEELSKTGIKIITFKCVTVDGSPIEFDFTEKCSGVFDRIQMIGYTFTDY